MRGQTSAQEHEQRLQVYARGLTDKASAEIIGIDRSSFMMWRKKNGLAAHNLSGGHGRVKEGNMRGGPVKKQIIAMLRRNVSVRLIAREMKIAINTLHRWRAAVLEEEPHLRQAYGTKKSVARAASGRAYSKLRIDRRRRAFLLWADGLNDRQIADEMDLKIQQIFNWRKAMHLAVNPRVKTVKVKPQPAKPITPMTNPLFRTIAAAIGWGMAPDLRDDAISEVCLELAEGTITEAEIASAAKRLRKRVFDAYADTRKRVSLDVTMPGTDGLRLIDMLRDDRSSNWLEEMGATAW